MRQKIVFDCAIVVFGVYGRDGEQEQAGNKQDNKNVGYGAW